MSHSVDLGTSRTGVHQLSALSRWGKLTVRVCERETERERAGERERDVGGGLTSRPDALGGVAGKGGGFGALVRCIKPTLSLPELQIFIGGACCWGLRE